MSESERITILLSSQKFNEPKADVESDAHTSFARGAMYVATTESGSDPVRHVVESVAKEHGYQGFYSEGGEHIFVASGIQVVSHGFVHVLDSLRAPASQGGHGPRPLQWVDTLTPAGNHVSLLFQHWLTGFHLGDNKTDNHRREGYHLEQTLAMAKEARARGVDKALAFWCGDTNLDAARDTGADHGGIEYTFKQAGLQSIYEALNEYPDTEGKSTYDVIGHFLNDKRVTPAKVTVFPQQHKDHRDVLAEYDIRPVRRPAKKHSR